MHKDTKKLLRKLELQGWRIVQGTKHTIAYPPDRTKRPVRIAGSPSDWRSWNNMIAELRRAGADI